MNPASDAALVAVQPQWTRVQPAARCVPLTGRWLLHAGPPYEPGQGPPAPVLASARLACRHEGWATTDAQAHSLIERGEIRLESAQQWRCVTPLAALISPSTTVAVVEDAAGAVTAMFAPLGTTGGPDLRFGNADPSILERLRRREEVESWILARALRQPIDLIALARQGLAGGDDLHNQTSGATRALRDTLALRIGAAATGAEQAFLAALDSTPLYFLTLWMAAARLMLSAAEGRAPGTRVTSMAGNGWTFGVQVAAAPGRWFTTEARAPEGPRLAQASAAAPALGAIGDSAVIDALGFGGQALALADGVRNALQPWLSDEPSAVATTLLGTPHPAFLDIGLRVGMDAQRIVERNLPPLVTLGMVAADGIDGLLGRGVYRPPVEVFGRAIASVSGELTSPST